MLVIVVMRDDGVGGFRSVLNLGRRESWLYPWRISTTADVCSTAAAAPRSLASSLLAKVRLLPTSRCAFTVVFL
jgi:hypothetical protein